MKVQRSTDGKRRTPGGYHVRVARGGVMKACDLQAGYWRPFRWLFATLASAQFSAASLPFVNDEAKAWIEKEYVAAGKQHKALALTEDGSWNFVQGRASLEDAVAGALSLCQQRSARYPCFIAAENDVLVVQSRYTPEAIEKAAIDLLKRAPQVTGFYANEDRDAGVAPTKTYRTRDAHAPTPRTVPDVKTISTKELVEVLTNVKPVLINVLGWKEGAFAIPGTTWIQGIAKPLDPAQMSELRKVLSDIAPDKNTPVILYCLSWECWMSYNTALTVRELDYTNVYWYRGGLESWNQAGLPVVRTRLYKQF